MQDSMRMMSLGTCKNKRQVHRDGNHQLGDLYEKAVQVTSPLISNPCANYPIQPCL